MTDPININPGAPGANTLPQALRLQYEMAGERVGVTPLRFAAAMAGHPVWIRPLSGAFVTTAGGAGALTQQVQVADTERLTPWLCPADIDIDQVAVSVSGAVAGNAKVTIYASDANGRPAALVAESGNIATSPTGTVAVALVRTLSGGVLYWIGVRTSSTPTLRSPALANTPSLSMSNAATPVHNLCLQRTLAYATAATDWTYANSQLNIASPALVLLRVA